MKKIKLKVATPQTITIKEVTDDYILFSDGSEITYDHEQDCCECNFADFEQLDDIARNYTYTLPLIFEPVEEHGFRFGDSRAMFFVPCYSHQNGYYSSDIQIYYNNEEKLHFLCEEDIC